MMNYDDMLKAELRNLRWQLVKLVAATALDLTVAISLLCLLIEWYGNLGPCRP